MSLPPGLEDDRPVWLIVSAEADCLQCFLIAAWSLGGLDIADSERAQSGCYAPVALERGQGSIFGLGVEPCQCGAG